MRPHREVEIEWDDGRRTSFDTRADWTLDVVDGAWPDPSAGSDAALLADLERTTGISFVEATVTVRSHAGDVRAELS